ncbi:type IV pilus inner membrane component PilO [Planctobacterium marinum]|uniref:type 4a pilus biogenesis protein PilO n=1 Tax=Planctobacterium marinum TaxID=1631968 RepID=UPI001E32B1E3|nr:type 4a pilus biogenesis protein PilO [Planctobacterium marinum]MCC2607621.1 type 4a pilus biogenesis protein PilO [Planctobacterium marinum]
MKFDFAKLKEMNDLDFEQIAYWPFEVKTVFALMVFIMVSGGAFYFLVKDKLPVLDAEQKREFELRGTYEAKYLIAANLEAYEKQLAQLKLDFQKVVKSLPTSNETPGLLDDITLVGTSSGLTFKGINWEKEIPKEFYTELPIRIEVNGEYHEFGEFLSEIASLPRIVTVHDFEMVTSGQELRLIMSAKTYRATPEVEAQ